MEVADGMAGQTNEGGGSDNVVQSHEMTLMVGWKKLAQLSVRVEGGETVSMGKEGEIVTPGEDHQEMLGQSRRME